MNVHVSYKVPKSRDVEEQIEHYIAKLRKRLQTYQPELVHLHVTVDENSPRTGFSVSLNLRLPSGQIAAQEQGTNADGAIKGAFDDLLEQLAKHKDHLRSQYKWPRRRRVGRTRPQPQVPFEETLAAVRPVAATSDDISSWINANLRRLERFVDRELRFRFNSGELPPGTITREEVIDEVVATALAEENSKPERLGLEPWLFRLARRTVDSVNHQNRETVETLSLDASMRQQNVRGTDDAQLQYHQPDETMTRESITRDPRMATPEDIAASEEIINMAELALLGATREERDAFILFAIEGFTVDEISAISDLKPEQVREAIKRARERLRKTVTGPNQFKDELLQHSRTA
ncbi:MAG TPA: sigma-70 family RNA polymerase sigma factor [Terriglobales bacterium]|nr:sigma-70 family RNA polymerase sigma factor [Terriglobales bacterium]